jgi:hypothetical protein
MNCGSKKKSPLDFCQNCGFQPRKNTDQALSKILSEHIHLTDELKEISAEIKRGKIFKYPEDVSGGYLRGFKKPRKRVDTTGASSFDFPLLFLFLLFLAAIATPVICLPVLGTHWTTLLAVGIFILWVSTMPSTCMDGGIITSFFAMTLLVQTCLWIGMSIYKLAKSIF